ncbi:hypothetical protein ScPMuIL_003076 [Solemya velum]
MKTGCPVLILICVMHFNLVFAKNNCAGIRNKCLRACGNAQSEQCKEQCESIYQRCVRYIEGRRKNKDNQTVRREGRKWPNPKRALIGLVLEAMTFDPKIIKMGTN